MYSLPLQLAYGLFSFFAPAALDNGLVVQTAQGQVQGTLLENGNRQFLGIPFAADTSKYRFRAPQAPPTHSQILDASGWGDSCPPDLGPSAQAFLKIAGLLDQQLNVTKSENCLNLNIWAPATTRPQNTAVMIWIYGGSGKFGTSNTLPYNGSFFVRDWNDITIVSINYRTNVLGFPNAPGTWNVGLLDIEYAIQWVYKNIGNFGGDPNRIVLFGESFGSLAIDAYTIRNPTDTIVKGVILESGLMALDEFIAPNSTQWPLLAAAVGCGNSNNVMQCMQAVPYSLLEGGIIKNSLSFTAGIDNYTMFADWKYYVDHGMYLRVPTLLGNNANEGDMFVAAYEATGGTLPEHITFDEASAACTDVLFHCPAFQSAKLRVETGATTWRYIYSGVFDNINNGNKTLRAFHTAEIPMVFQTYNFSTFTHFPATPVEISLSKYIQGGWVAFARNPSLALDNYNWRRFVVNDILHPSINVLGGPENPASVTYERTADHDAGCSELDDLIPIVLPIIKHLNGHTF
ncbi:alpha/beta-hydrolase [Dacryopinax primogenitus]|uniref:Alpha/beta-hydrolase n=1 Tax=Dacryopinax primogenitus (strain DJM 731) TaxID=1858805 RepID=M5FPS7_DACPD|nr:alpha/beta-hydrolase [Dacryopinax primogenitus]EJT98750.1 alpha/beta-hydrolase [Dacryopinax primogenitus]